MLPYAMQRIRKMHVVFRPVSVIIDREGEPGTTEMPFATRMFAMGMAQCSMCSILPRSGGHEMDGSNKRHLSLMACRCCTHRSKASP